MKMLDRVLTRATVRSVQQVAPRMREIHLGTRKMDWQPGQHVKVFFGLRSRDYSIYDADSDGVVLRMFHHGNGGPGEGFASAAATGDSVFLTRPEGRLVLRPEAPFHLLVGEETASVAFGAIIRAVPAAGTVFAVVECDGPEHHIPLPRPDSVTWAYRDGTSLVDRVRSLPLPSAPGIAYVAGEAKTCQAIRKHLLHERNWPRRNVLVHAFWS